MLQRHERLTFASSIHFATTVTGVRGNWFVVPDQCRRMLELLEGYRARLEVRCLGYVLMPDHLHVLLCQDTDAPLIPRLVEGFKSVSARTLKPEGYPASRLWAKRYDDVPVPGSDAARTKLEYMHNNPVKRELVGKPEEYLWSSARTLMGYEGNSIVTLSPL
jgi:REP element-mobilizing transposase RayT